MAVVDTYTNANAASGKTTFPGAIVSGGESFSIVATYSPAAGDSANSIYRFFKDVPSNSIPIDLGLATTSNVSTGTCHIGVYKPGGAAADEDCLAASLSTATASRKLDGLASVAIADKQKTLAELAGLDSSKYPTVDIAVKAVSAFGAQAIALTGTFLQK